MPQLALRFISGKYQGGEFPLKVDSEVVIGRSSDLDMVLVEDMVSRKHAKIDTTSDQIFIQDLGSTNGTFVNGEKIKRVRLNEGDRVLIGTSILKLVAIDQTSVIAKMPPATDVDGPAEPAGMTKQLGVSGPRPMSGSIEEIPLPDLLQLLSTSRKSGVLAIRAPQGVGKICFRKGQIYYASIDDNFALRPHKAIYRLLRWQSGSFELEPPDDRTVIEEIRDSTESLLIEGARHLDEIRRLLTSLPPPSAQLAVPTPLAGKLRDLSPEALDVFQLVLDHGGLEAVLDNYPGTDLEGLRLIASLLSADLVTVT